jgi:hypothetical protein
VSSEGPGHRASLDGDTTDFTPLRSTDDAFRRGDDIVVVKLGYLWQL